MMNCALEECRKPYLAHVRRNDDGSFAIHGLDEHLRAVGDLAGEFASSFGHPDWGRLAGLWHDLGKYSSAFQNYIAHGSGLDPEAHIEGGSSAVSPCSREARRHGSALGLPYRRTSRWLA